MKNKRFQNNRNKTEKRAKENRNFLHRAGNIELAVNRISANQVFSSNIFSLSRLQFSALFSKISFMLWFVQKQPPEVFYKKAVLKSFAVFTGKHLC